MLRRAQYYVDNHKIEIVDTFFGKEKILVNGKVRSERPTDRSVEHTFHIDKDKYRIIKRDSSKADKMNLYQVIRNDHPVALVDIKKTNTSQLFLLMIAVGLGCGYIFGVLLFHLLSPGTT
jgi:hypothetical protein